jgi:hypothetical protein
MTERGTSACLSATPAITRLARRFFHMLLSLDKAHWLAESLHSAEAGNAGPSSREHSRSSQ